jgi:hypothetical protein
LGEDAIMILKLKIALAILLAIAVATPTLLVWASETQRFVLSKELHVTDFVPRDVDAYIAYVNDSKVEVAHIYVRVEHPMPNSHRVPILFSIWHTEDTELDSLVLRFSTDQYVTSVYTEASSYNWPESRFYREGRQTILAVNDMGWFGVGTVTLNFMLFADSHSENLGLIMDFSMHHEAFMQLTSLKGHANLYTPIPT